MRYPARRELLARVASRYREANHAQKTTILDEFVAAGPWPQRVAVRALLALARRPRGRALLAPFAGADQALSSVGARCFHSPARMLPRP